MIRFKLSLTFGSPSFMYVHVTLLRISVTSILKHFCFMLLYFVENPLATSVFWCVSVLLFCNENSILFWNLNVYSVKRKERWAIWRIGDFSKSRRTVEFFWNIKKNYKNDEFISFSVSHMYIILINKIYFLKLSKTELIKIMI